MLAVTPLDVYEAIEGAIITGLAVIAAVGVMWLTVGKPIHKRLFDESTDKNERKRGFFPRLEQRFDEFEAFQSASVADRAEIRRELLESQRNVERQMLDLAKVTKDHELRLRGVEKDTSYLKGKEDARIELAQARAAVSDAIDSAGEEGPLQQLE